MLQAILTELALTALRMLVKYAENEITDTVVEDVAQKTRKGIRKAAK